MRYSLCPIFGIAKLLIQLCVHCAKIMRKTCYTPYGPVGRLPAFGTHLHSSIKRSPPPHLISLTCFLDFCRYKRSSTLKYSLSQLGCYGIGETLNILADQCTLSDSFVPWRETWCRSTSLPRSLNQSPSLLPWCCSGDLQSPSVSSWTSTQWCSTHWIWQASVLLLETRMELYLEPYPCPYPFAKQWTKWRQLCAKKRFSLLKSWVYRKWLSKAIR